MTREPFDLDITEKEPTRDQVETILGYVEKEEIPQIVSGAGSVADALRKFKMDKGSFKTPLVSFLGCGEEKGTLLMGFVGC